MDYHSTDALRVVTATPVFLREGSRGGWMVRGIDPAYNTVTSYMWAKDSEAELTIPKWVEYVNRCLERFDEPHGFETWLNIGRPQGLASAED